MVKQSLLLILFSLSLLQAQNSPAEWSANGWNFNGWNGNSLDSSATSTYIHDSSATHGTFSQYFSSGGQTQMLDTNFYLFNIYWKKVFLNTNVPISFLFDFKVIDINSIDAVYLTFIFGKHFNWYYSRGITENFEIGQWNNIEVNVVNPPGNQFNIIEFELGFQTTSSNIIHFEYLIDNLRLVYGDTTVLIDDFGDVLTNINETKNGQKVNQYLLSQNYPNPFNPSTIINFSIPKEEFVELVVYDVNGGIVKELVNGLLTVGNHSVSFNASDIASGVYFYQLRTKNFTSTKKLILLH
jgi:hypothetical protein